MGTSGPQTWPKGYEGASLDTWALRPLVASQTPAGGTISCLQWPPPPAHRPLGCRAPGARFSSSMPPAPHRLAHCLVPIFQLHLGLLLVRGVQVPPRAEGIPRPKYGDFRPQRLSAHSAVPLPLSVQSAFCRQEPRRPEGPTTHLRLMPTLPQTSPGLRHGVTHPLTGTCSFSKTPRPESRSPDLSRCALCLVISCSHHL